MAFIRVRVRTDRTTSMKFMYVELNEDTLYKVPEISRANFPEKSYHEKRFMENVPGFSGSFHTRDGYGKRAVRKFELVAYAYTVLLFKLLFITEHCACTDDGWSRI